MYDRPPIKGFEHQVDSRKVLHPSRTVFYCLPGKRRDGHDFIASLYAKGCRHFVVSKEVDARPDAHYYQVENVLATLQNQAQRHRQQVTCPVLAITGSNGKTTVKEWLYELLKPHFNVYRSPGSYNSQIGVPLSILGIRENHQLAIIEAGISRTGEMARLQQMIQPDFGLFTSLGSAHDAGFSSREEKFDEKKKLFSDVQWWLSYEQNEACPDSFPLKDPASQSNMALILSFIKKWKPEIFPQVLKQIPYVTPISMRSQVKAGMRNNTLLCDYYNADWEGLVNSLQVVGEIEPQKPRVLILSELLDTRDRVRWIDALSHILQDVQLNKVILVGQFSESEKQQLNIPGLVFYPSTKTVIDSHILEEISHHVIILKGARIFAFEQLERELALPAHGTRLEVDMEALLHNWSTLGNIIGPEVKRLAMIKAVAYGSGLIRMGRFFAQHGADYLGVAYPNEGIELREHDIALPILVLNANPSSAPTLIKYHLEPVVYDLDQVRNLYLSGVRVCHLEINTGMNRLGFDEKDINPLVHFLQHHEDMKVASIMSHFSASEKEEKDSFSRHQLELFTQISQHISDQIGYRPIWHMANSHGAIRLPEGRLDMVRLGLALYGLSSLSEEVLNLTPVHRMVSHISQIRRVPSGSSIGYGADYILQEERVIATIPAGYADGIPRALGRGQHHMWIRNQEASTVGDICMDMTMLDVTDIKDVKVGDVVEIFGTKTSLGEFALAAQTIPYEILTRIGQRVMRVFING